MDRLEAMSVIVAVAEAGSLSAAARKLGRPIATVSRKLSELEARLNAQLFQRSSRHMTLTDAGRSYIESCRRIIEQVEDAERQVSGEYRTPSGDLTVTAPWGLGHMHLLPISCEFLNEYPEISLRLLLTDRVLNPQEEKIDVAIRIGHLPDSSLIATRIGSVRFVACASPDYLEAHGVATEPGDLSEHNCILIKDGGGARPWKFSKAGNDVPASISSRLTVSTSEAAVEAAIAGAGIARVMHYKMEAARLAGKLIVNLKDFELEALPVHIVHAEWRPVPLKLRAYLDWVTPRLKVRLP